MKRISILSILLLPTFAIAAPFCAVTGFSTTCTYYDVQSCRFAAGPGGACVVNSNEVHPDTGSNRMPPIKYIDNLDSFQRGRDQANKQRTEDQQSELRHLEIEQKQRDLDRQNMELQQQEHPRISTTSPTPAPDLPLTMVCYLEQAGQHLEVTVTVDMVNQTVDDRQAQITDRYISWEVKTKDDKSHYSINRFTGLMMVYGQKGTAQGKCEVSSQGKRKF